jgi:hypothetical protein
LLGTVQTDYDKPDLQPPRMRDWNVKKKKVPE